MVPPAVSVSPRQEPQPAPRMQGEGIYRAMLREIGYEDETMGYLFASDDDNDNDDGNDAEFSLLDSSSSGVNETNTDDVDDGDEDNNKNINVKPGGNHPIEASMKDLNDLSNGSDSLLHEWEEQDETSPPKASGKRQVEAEADQQQERLPEWRERLNEAKLQQQQLKEQFFSLQHTQRQSSPQSQAQATVHHANSQEAIPAAGSTASSVENHEPIRPSKSSSPSSSFVLQQLSKRDAQLQEQWTAQKSETNELQDKLASLQRHFQDDQKQWEEDQTLLFSPVQHSTAKSSTNGGSINRNRSNSGKRKSTRSPSTKDAYPSSLPTLSTAASTLRSPVPSSPREPRRANVQHPTLEKDVVNENSSRFCLSPPLQSSDIQSTSDAPPRPPLLADSQEREHLQQELEECKAKLVQKEREHQALLVAFETEKGEWNKSLQIVNAQHETEKIEWAHELETAKDKFHHQVMLNQDLREELQELKKSNTEWKNELDDARAKIQAAVQQQSQKAQEFQDRIRMLEDRHDQERVEWNDQLQEYRKQLEENTVEWEEQLQLEKDRYRALQEKHERELNKWQTLLEREMIEDNGDGVNQRGTSCETPANAFPKTGNEASSDYSIKDKSTASESMEKIDGLLEELGRMDEERAAVLDEINGERMSNSPNSNERHEHDDEEIPMPLDSPQSSRASGVEPYNVLLNTTSDSTVLDQTLSLLNSLKDLMANGNGTEQEATVLEHLEVLSDLMQESGYQSSIDLLSPGQNLSATSQGLVPPEEIGRDTSWVSSVKVTDMTDPWPALVDELRSRIVFLEQDRAELARITDCILQKERESHHVEIEAAVATAKREANEKLHQHHQEATRTIRGIYRGLCVHCRQRVYESL